MAQDQFSKKYGDRITGTLGGFDRLLLKGIFRLVSSPGGLQHWLNQQGISRHQFLGWAKALTARLQSHGPEVAREAGRPYRFVGSSKIRKETLVEQIRQRDGIREGLVCVLAAIEPCWSYDLVGKNRQDLVRHGRKCLFLYFYLVHREFGLLHVRLQTWFPFDIQVCLNGREWLARQMDRAAVKYDREDNCFVWIEDLPRAQQLADRQARIHWDRQLKSLAHQANPLLGEALKDLSYYWMVRQGEYAIDIMFRSRQDLAAIYPQLVRHAIEHFHSEDVLRFLGVKQPRQYQGARVESDRKRRLEGVRVRHGVMENGLKMYDKQGRVLRVELTINNPVRFRVFRRDRQDRMRWMQLRRGTVDIRRRVEISRAVIGRSLEALASVPEGRPAAEIWDPVSRPVIAGSQRFRALRPIAPEESRALAAVLQGQGLVQGFGNRELRTLLFPDADPARVPADSGQVTRLLRWLRAHHIIRKVTGMSRYQITPRGIGVCSTALQLRNSDVQQLPRAA
jgi:hypothetical protein